jgi:hypothetical protein
MPPAVVAVDHSIFIALPGCPVSFCLTCCKITGHIAWQGVKRDRGELSQRVPRLKGVVPIARGWWQESSVLVLRTSISPGAVATSHETDLSDAVRQTQLLLHTQLHRTCRARCQPRSLCCDSHNDTARFACWRGDSSHTWIERIEYEKPNCSLENRPSMAAARCNITPATRSVFGVPLQRTQAIPGWGPRWWSSSPD